MFKIVITVLEKFCIMKKFKNIVVFIVACFIFSQAFAGYDTDEIFEQINNSWAVGLAGLNINYKEIFLPSDAIHPPFKPKSTEAGTIVGLTFDKRTAFFRKIYTDLYLDFYNGELEYDGSYQKTHEPLVFNARHIFFNADAKLGGILTFANSFSLQIIPYVGVGYRYWDRGYNNILEEEYQHFKNSIGLKLDWLLTDNCVLSPYIEGGKTFSARMKDTNGDLGTFTLGNKPIYSVGLELNYKMSYKFFLNGFVDFTSFEYGRSEYKHSVERKGDYCEPASKTNEIKVGLGIRFG